MWPILSNIDPRIESNIKSSTKNSMNPSVKNPWVRIFGGAVYNDSNGIVLQSNTDWKIFSAAGEKTASIYGSPQGGVIGVDWNGYPVFVGSGTSYRPAPVVTNLSVREGKDQISRQCSFSIKCFSLEQLEAIQAFFMEPGYSVAVEWGFNSENINPIDTNGGQESILNNITTNTLNTDSIESYRLNSMGETDIFLGFIIGSTVTNDDVNFNVEVNLRGAPSLPTYLQGHRRLIPRGKKNDEGKYVYIKDTDKSKIPYSVADQTRVSTGDDNNIIRDRRFAYMFNELPAFRQTETVKSLREETKSTDFINFDKVISDKIGEFVNKTNWIGITKTNVQIGKLTLEREALFSPERYIKFDLAVKILNKTGVDDMFYIGDKRIHFNIDIDNVMIGGFPYMFSTNKYKLIIPGIIPDFRSYFLGGYNIEQLQGGKTGGSVLLVDGVKKYPRNPDHEGADNITPFLENGDLDDGLMREQGWYYGYLKNLYINFDMFKSKIEQDNKTVREIFTDILNEMSSAVNGFWNFQIVEMGYKQNVVVSKSLPPKPDFKDPNSLRTTWYGGSVTFEENAVEPVEQPLETPSPLVGEGTKIAAAKKGDIYISVIDENWGGEVPRNISKVVAFEHMGPNSPFLNSSLDVSIPAELTNKIIMERLSLTSNPEMPVTELGGIFNSKTDLFIKSTNVTTETTTESPDTSLTADQKSNMDAKKKFEEDDLNLKNTLKDYTETKKGSITQYRDGGKDGKIVASYDTNTNQYISYTNIASDSQNQSGIGIALSSIKPKTEIDGMIRNRNTSYKKMIDTFDSDIISAHLKKLGIFPKPRLGSIPDISEETYTSGKWDNMFNIYTFDDPDYFEKLKNDSFQFDKFNFGKKSMSHPLPIKYSFTILGNSGIRRGDMFRISGIPERYSEHGVFQVVEVEHAISDMKWTTTVTGQYRQIQ
jgi:hypothetical protein